MLDGLLSRASGQINNWANSSTPPDVNATNVMNDANANVPPNNAIDPWSQDTVDTQNSLIKDGYGHLLGDTGADGRMGPKTREAMAARDKANAGNNNNTNQGAAPQDPGYVMPSYGNPFNRF